MVGCTIGNDRLSIVIDWYKPHITRYGSCNEYRLVESGPRTEPLSNQYVPPVPNGTSLTENPAQEDHISNKSFILMEAC